MTRSLFLALLLPAAILGGLEDCTEFTVGQCQPPQELIVGLQHLPCDSLDLTTCASICQKICSVEANCDFFSYDAVTEDCVLLRETEHNGYYATCGVLAGGPAPTMWECDQQLPVDDCKRFVYENCEYKGTEVYAERDVTYASDCQYLLAEIGKYYDAEMFLHNVHDFSRCSFLSSRERECTGVNGPVHPSFDECFGGNVTTTVSPTGSTPAVYDKVNVIFRALDATNNNLLSGLEINVQNYNDSLFTDSNGEAELLISQVEFPYYLSFQTFKVGYEMYNNTVMIRNDQPSQIVAFSVSPTLTPDQSYRLVLNWGPQPSDLDLHVIEFDLGGNYVCETYYSNKNGCIGLSLDVDNTQGGDNGAETITWSTAGPLQDQANSSPTPYPTTAYPTTAYPTTAYPTTAYSTAAPTSAPSQYYTYLMFVYRYAGLPQIEDSQAELRLYGDDGNILHFDVPAADRNSTDRYWLLGCFDSRLGLGSLNLINAIVKDKPLPSDCSR